MHFDKAISLAIGILKNEQSAADAVQISFLRAYDYRRSYNDRKPFLYWFNRILINECKRYMHNYSKYEDQYSVLNKDEIAEENYRFEKYEMLYSALQNLSDDMRIPLLMKYVNGYKESEIADVLNIKSSTIKSRLYEGRKKIRSMMISSGYKEYDHE